MVSKNGRSSWAFFYMPAFFMGGVGAFPEVGLNLPDLGGGR